MTKDDSHNGRAFDDGFDPQGQDFVDEVRRFLAKELTPELRNAAARQAGVYAHPDLALKWHRILYKKGWIAPSWAPEYGGTGWTASQRLIFENECARAGAPVLPAMALQMCGPTLIAFGSEEQKERFLPRILSGDDYWCQGYSESQAGSDLAALKTKAVRQGDKYTVNGSKIWTTHAHFANWIFMLVRTNTEVRPQAGISFLLCPMEAPGIHISPIRSLSGEHEVNEVFFDNVEVPIELRVGNENQGWAIAKHLLRHERGGVSASGRSLRVLSNIQEIASAAGADGRRPIDDPVFRKKLAELEIEISATDWTQRRLASGVRESNQETEAVPSMLKMKAAECYQMATEMAFDALGQVAMIDQVRTHEAFSSFVGPAYAETATARYLNSRAMSIFGGVKEVQADLVARAILKA